MFRGPEAGSGLVARKGKAPELEMRRRRHYWEGGWGGTREWAGRSQQEVRKGGGTVGELRVAIEDNFGHVILMGVSWSECKEEV